jgi:hypothetical protein
MNMYPSFTNNYGAAADQFSALRSRARWASLLAKLTGRNLKLASFPEHAQRDHPNRKMIGTKDIRVDQIVGTLNRDCDFDNQFRPLEKHLLERWVNIFVYLHPDSWEPIIVHKIDDQYYVEDGHHRVSVARSLGMFFIQAKVWEYPVQKKKPVICGQSRCAERSPIKSTRRVPDHNLV